MKGQGQLERRQRLRIGKMSVILKDLQERGVQLLVRRGLGKVSIGYTIQ